MSRPIYDFVDFQYILRMAKKDEPQQNPPAPRDDEVIEEAVDEVEETEPTAPIDQDDTEESAEEPPGHAPELALVSQDEDDTDEEESTADSEDSEPADESGAVEETETTSEDDQEVSGEVETVSVDEIEELTTEQVIEALLFVSDVPLPLSKLVNIVGVGSARDARKHIENLNARYAETGAAFRIESIAGGYQMLTLPAFNTWLRRLKQSRQETKLSPAALETLAVVAYKQPVVRADVEAIRGVSAGEMLNRLREMGLVKIVGRAEDVGRPMLYGTTKRFLEVFGLASLEDLPQVEEFGQPS